MHAGTTQGGQPVQNDTLLRQLLAKMFCAMSERTYGSWCDACAADDAVFALESGGEVQELTGKTMLKAFYNQLLSARGPWGEDPDVTWSEMDFHSDISGDATCFVNETLRQSGHAEGATVTRRCYCLVAGADGLAKRITQKPVGAEDLSKFATSLSAAKRLVELTKAQDEERGGFGTSLALSDHMPEGEYLGELTPEETFDVMASHISDLMRSTNGGGLATWLNQKVSDHVAMKVTNGFGVSKTCTGKKALLHLYQHVVRNIWGEGAEVTWENRRLDIRSGKGAVFANLRIARAGRSPEIRARIYSFALGPGPGAPLTYIGLAALNHDDLSSMLAAVPNTPSRPHHQQSHAERICTSEKKSGSRSSGAPPPTSAAATARVDASSPMSSAGAFIPPGSQADVGSDAGGGTESCRVVVAQGIHDSIAAAFNASGTEIAAGDAKLERPQAAASSGSASPAAVAVAVGSGACSQGSFKQSGSFDNQAAAVPMQSRSMQPGTELSSKDHANNSEVQLSNGNEHTPHGSRAGGSRKRNTVTDEVSTAVGKATPVVTARPVASSQSVPRMTAWRPPVATFGGAHGVVVRDIAGQPVTAKPVSAKHSVAAQPAIPFGQPLPSLGTHGFPPEGPPLAVPYYVSVVNRVSLAHAPQAAVGVPQPSLQHAAGLQQQHQTHQPRLQHQQHTQKTHASVLGDRCYSCEQPASSTNGNRGNTSCTSATGNTLRKDKECSKLEQHAAATKSRPCSAGSSESNATNSCASTPSTNWAGTATVAPSPSDTVDGRSPWKTVSNLAKAASSPIVKKPDLGPPTADPTWLRTWAVDTQHLGRENLCAGSAPVVDPNTGIDPELDSDKDTTATHDALSVFAQSMGGFKLGWEQAKWYDRRTSRPEDRTVTHEELTQLGLQAMKSTKQDAQSVRGYCTMTPTVQEGGGVDISPGPTTDSSDATNQGNVIPFSSQATASLNLFGHAEQEPLQGEIDEGDKGDEGCGDMPACTCNQWDSLRIKRKWCLLRCRACGTNWRLPASTVPMRRCAAFMSADGCTQQPCPSLHIYMRKQRLEERLRTDDVPSVQDS